MINGSERFFYCTPSTTYSVSDLEYGINLLRQIDSSLANSLSNLLSYLSNNQDVDVSSSIADLCLDFTFPGMPLIELRPGGCNIEVTKNNLCEYITKVIRVALVEGISAQVYSFREGFRVLYSESNLGLLSVNESQSILCCGPWNGKWKFESI